MALGLAYRLLFGINAFFSGACLEPFPEGDPAAPADLFGPVGLLPGEAEASVDLPPDLDIQMTRLRGFAGGSTVAFWRVSGPLGEALVPVFRVAGPDGLGPPIVDVLPGDTGYSPFWRLHRVRATDAYDGRAIWSREAVEAGVELGLLESPEPTEVVFYAPIAGPDVTLETEGERRRASPIWYRRQRATWVRFPGDLALSVEARKIEVARSYVFQRVDQPFVLDEDMAGFDLDRDGLLVSTHEVLPTEALACRRQLARTSTAFASIDGPGLPDIRSVEHPALQAVGEPPLLEVRDLGEVVACPREVGP